MRIKYGFVIHFPHFYFLFFVLKVLKVAATKVDFSLSTVLRSLRYFICIYRWKRIENQIKIKCHKQN